MIAESDVLDRREFLEICENFRSLEARKSADEATVNYEQARLILDARVRLKVRIASICEALELSHQSVNTYRSVAERIDERSFRGLIEEHRPDGLPLFPWSIIVQLARLEDARERADAIQRIRLGAWNARRAEEYISSKRRSTRPRKRGSHGDGDSRAGPAPRLGDGLEARGDPRLVEPDTLTPAGSDLARRAEGLVRSCAKQSSASTVSVIVLIADVATRIVRDATAALGRASVRELALAHDNLKRCLQSVVEAQHAIEIRLAEAEAHERREGAAAADDLGCVLIDSTTGRCSGSNGRSSPERTWP
jgi:hypothetical protein